jgi:5-methyltetrahydrofolate--homocysteine methyltransferase
VTAPPIPDTRIHIVREIPIEAVMPLVDFRASAFARLKVPKERRDDLRQSVERLAAGGAFPLAGVYRFARAHREGTDAVLEMEDWILPTRIALPKNAGGWSAADALADSADAGGSLALFVVTAGRVTPQARLRAADGKLAEAHLLEMTALALAEACAAWMHGEVRRIWTIGPDEGFRISPGYPACPDLSVQKTLFELLRPEAVGITLTEAMMMDPEASVSAIAFHQGKRETRDDEE